MKLHLGSGGRMIPGWINLDKRAENATFSQKNSDFVVWEAPSKLPFKDGSVDYIYTEHFIEHIDEADGFVVLNDCYRVLKPGGVVRICTPSIDKYIEMFFDWENKKKGRDFLSGTQFINYAIIGESNRGGGRLKYLKKYDDGHGKFSIFSPPPHDHRFLYSEADLSEKLSRLSFSSVSTVEWGKSSSEPLSGIESHHELLELIIEARK